MIEKILVGVKGDLESDNALRYAARLASITGAQLTALHVIEELDEYHFYEDIELKYEVETRLEKKECIQRIKDACEEHGLKGIDIEIMHGNPARGILREARKGDYDLIVVGSHGKSRFLEFLIGGVAFQIIHYAKRPVLVVKRLKEMRTILACTDGSGYAQDAMKFTAEIAKPAESMVTVLYVAREGCGKLPESKDIVAKSREILEKAGIKAETTIREGPTAEEILREAREKDYDLIVMGHKGKSSIREFLLGDVVSKVTHHSLRPTLVYREKREPLSSS
jgi:nucleotide-binding universal stress UspA family protein